MINGEWGHNPGEVGFGSVYLSVTANPGDYIQAITTYAMVIKYTEQQVNPGGCGVFCLDWFDAYYYGFMEDNPEGMDIPTFTTTVWAAPIVIAAVHAAKTISLGQNGSSYRVPGGGTVFDLKLRAFIPPAWINGPPVVDNCIAGNGTTRSTIYAGDNRGFDPFSTSFRTYSNVTVSSFNATALWTYFAAGKTIRYASDAIAPDGYTLYSDSVLHDCHYTDNVVYEQTYDMHSSTGGGNGTVNTHLWGSCTDLASNAQSWAPGIDWDFVVSINTASNPSIPAYSVTYHHDCYPAHELFIGTQFVYGYKPTSNSSGTVAGCLAGFAPVSGTTVGTVN